MDGKLETINYEKTFLSLSISLNRYEFEWEYEFPHGSKEILGEWMKSWKRLRKNSDCYEL